MANLLELSKKTLGSYIKKAAFDGINKASSGAYKLANTSADNQFKIAGDDGEKDDKTAVRRAKGVALAADKLTKESIETIKEEDMTTSIHEADITVENLIAQITEGVDSADLVSKILFAKIAEQLEEKKQIVMEQMFNKQGV